MSYNIFMADHKTIISPEYGRKDIYQQLTNDSKVIFGYEVIPFNSFKSTLANEMTDDDVEFCQLYHKTITNIPESNIYHDELRYPAFFRYFYDFVNEMIDNGITPDDLPVDYDNKDKKEILSFLYAQNLNHKIIEEQFRNTNDATDIMIYDCYDDDLTEYKKKQYLINLGAKTIKPTTGKNTSSISCFARNISREIASIAQYLVKNRDNYELNDIAIMVNEPEKYLPVISQIFDTYNIPFTNQQSIKAPIITRFTDLVNYIAKPDIDTFLKAYVSGCFDNVSISFLQYQEHFRLTYQQLQTPFTIVSNWDWQKAKLCSQKDYDYLLKKEQEAEKTMAPVRELMETMPFSANLKTVTTFAYNYMLSKIDETNPLDVNGMKAIYDLCVRTVGEMGDNVELLTYFLNGLSVSKKTSYSNAITICSPYQSIVDKKLAIVVGCNQAVFPKSINKSGFFDEAYLQNIRNYPSLSERTRHFNQQLAAIYDNIPEVIYSYSLIDTDGKALDPSNFITKRTKDPEKWPLTENNFINSYEESLTEETARSLYLKDNTLFASPSGFESYIGCPYKFFLDKGLRLYHNEMFDIESNTVGTMQHAIMEEMFKNGVEFDRSTLERYIDFYFDSLKELFINDVDQLEFKKQNLIENLLTKTEFLSIARENSSFQPKHFEEKVGTDIKADDFNIRMHGTIDRVDEADGEFMIVDYKSSAKSISKENIYRGKSLQLLTYLLIYSVKTGLTPFGMAYYNLKNDSKVNTSGKPEEQMAMDKNKYSAYITDPKNQNEKDYYSYSRFYIEPEKYFEVIKEIYKLTAEKILSGNISIDPVNDACTFCKFRKICHSNLDSSNKSDYIVVPEEDDNAES